MGTAKLALPLGTKTILEHVVTVLRQAGLEHILVVIGPHVPELRSPAEAAGAQVLALAAPTQDMRETVERGLRWIEEHRSPKPGDRWLLAPADHPTLEPAVIRQLLASAVTERHPLIFVATYNGRRGHPSLFRWLDAAALSALPTGLGVNSYLRSHSEETVEIPVDSPEILRDLDRPQDYEELLTWWNKRAAK
jgi:molybdenum cofactor cytidylyltransferase